MFGSAGEWGGGPALGVVGNVFGIRAALAGSAIVLTPALALYGRAIRHQGREPGLGAVLPASVDLRRSVAATSPRALCPGLLAFLRGGEMAQMAEARDRATSDPAERGRVLERIKEEGMTSSSFWFTDLEGPPKSFAITPAEIESALDDGMGFDGSSITDFNAIEESDMVAIPDPTTFQLVPYSEGDRSKVGRIICEVVTPDGEPYEGDPRFVLRRAVERMREMGFDTFNIGPELDYFLFKSADDPSTLDGRLLRADDLDAATEIAGDDPRAEVDGHSRRVRAPRVGPSQREIDVRYADALDMADHVLTYRLIVKEIAAKNGVYATFMPKPIFGENGSGMHTHQSLFTDGRNAFFDADDKWHLSDVGKAFIAGQLRHAREIAGVFAQWVNSYKRLVPGYEAPVYVAWSQRNRSALIRIPLYKPGSEQATRAEIRCPDPACNPYLTFACLPYAGLEGIENGYELPEPMETNLYHLAAEQRRERGIVSLPGSPGKAIDELSPSRSSPARRWASTSSIATSRSSGRSGTSTASSSRSGRWSAT